MTEIVIALLPLLFLVSALLLGHYPGCDTIVRLGARFAAAPGSRPVATPPRPKAPRTRTAGGGLLIALGIAQRPPPFAP